MMSQRQAWDLAAGLEAAVEVRQLDQAARGACAKLKYVDLRSYVRTTNTIGGR